MATRIRSRTSTAGWTLKSTSDAGGGASLPWIVWLGGLFPGAWHAARWAQNDFGANPIAEMLNATGELAIKTLLLCLACTPLRLLFGWTSPMRMRKHLGLLCALYATVHFSLYIGVDRYGEWATLLDDISGRPFVIVGALALTLLMPLVVTSFNKVRRRLKPRAWVRLHKLVYVVGGLAVLHFVMRSKKDLTVALLHGAVFALLMGVRVVDAWRKRLRRSVGLRGA